MLRLAHCALLLVVLIPNKSGGYSVSEDEQIDDLMVFYMNFTIYQDNETLKEAFRETFAENNTWVEISADREDDESAQQKMKNGRDQAVPFTTESRKNNTIQLCCPLGHRFSLKQEKCLVDNINVTFPNMYETDDPLHEVFDLVVRSPCNNKARHFMIDPVNFPDSVYGFFENASVYFLRVNYFIPSTKYCLATVNQERFDLIVCRKHIAISVDYVSAAIFISLPFLLITFVVYSILPEFQNIHGYMLRAYIASMFVTITILAVFLQLLLDNPVEDYSLCAPWSYVFHFAIYSTFLWLNVTCFNVWRTFGELHSMHQRRLKSNRARFAIYSLYAWGVPFVVTILTIVMDVVPNIPDYLIRPQICKAGFWFGTKKAKTLYFYIPIGISLICNSFLFVWTALRILYHKKRIDRQMENSESRCHDNNKERFWVYLKLFILMGLNWIMELATWLFDNKPYEIEA
ncbi:G-protein coupled receptor Mth2-like isoform X2 [Pseudomyrmex gracilis]|uniref:G-protein coupled receptor Mth2-like isoform X2 n=1 Tax=Pseudomyrmex gracilis TaxID=219809 RepID=UPI000995BD20|nr:G-protein coupled receptor Mth2-like isoform X2 [Pseudomyrmex gracilis]